MIHENDRKNRTIKCLYVRVLRALYGCIKSTLLWYELYSLILIKMGFKINPYDRCVVNKVINGHQCTIVLYVDNNKISHRDPEVVSEVLDAIPGHFGDLLISRGRKRGFLGMNIEFKERMVLIKTEDQVKEAIEWGKSQGGCKPADSEPLSKNEADYFHSVVQKLLYICKRTRPDIEPAQSYLCTRVSEPRKDDNDKLTCVLGFLEKILKDKRKIGATDLQNLVTWVDPSYVPHKDMKSHTGGIMSFGHGTLHTKSSKQKLNTKSSTEAELVRVSDHLLYNIWMSNFMKEQGYDLKSNVLYQDNQSPIRMEVNGRNSCTGNSRYIDIRYFFVKDQIDKGYLTVKYCPTEQMLADFFTKPLQGALFNKFRSEVMKHVPITLPTESSREIKERVEDPAN